MMNFIFYCGIYIFIVYLAINIWFIGGLLWVAWQSRGFYKKDQEVLDTND